MFRAAQGNAVFNGTSYEQLWFAKGLSRYLRAAKTKDQSPSVGKGKGKGNGKARHKKSSKRKAKRTIL